MFKRSKEPGRSSDSRGETGRWSLLRLLPDPGRSDKAAPASDHYPTEKDVVTRPSGHSTADRNAPKTASASISVANRSESCTSNDRTAPETGEASTTNQKSLWDLAYEALEREKPDVVKAYEELLLETTPYLEDASPTTDLDELLSRAPANVPSTPYTHDAAKAEYVAQSFLTRRMKMENMIALGKKHMEGKKIAFTAGNQQFVLQDQTQYVVTGMQLGIDWISDAVKASPLASTAWAGVCLLLPLLTNQRDVQAANNEGFAYVTQKIRYYAAMESLLFGSDDEMFPPAFKDHVVELYREIIDFQAQSVLRFFRSRFRNFVRDAVKRDPWDDMLKKVKDLGAQVEKESIHINTALSRAALSVLAKRAIETEEDKCLQSLRRGDYAWYKDRLEERVPDTCLWFLNHSSFQSWLGAKSGPLLVSADPGCGKSVLAKYLVDSRFGFSLPKEAVICYFFFKDPDQHTIDLALCALIHQLLCLRPQLIRHALPRYKQDGEGLKSNVTVLWDILETATADPEAGTVIIVLDALDECLQDERNMSTLSRYIKTHFENGHKKHLKILMTSRPYEGTIGAIQLLEKSFPHIRIRGEDDSDIIRREINSVIEYRVDRMVRFNDDPQLKPYLKRRLMDITHRTYLWLYLIFDYLENSNIKSTIQGLADAIKHLPSSINQAYENILNRSTDPEEATKALRILLAACRPLTLLEFQIALSVTINTRCLENLDLEPDEAFKRRLRGVCGLFVTVHDGKVYFLHQTAKEFLVPHVSISTTASNGITRWANKFSTRSAHMALAEACTVYLTLLTPPAVADVKCGFRSYSATNWGTHFREASFADGAAILPFALALCDPNSKNNSMWFSLFWSYTHPFSRTSNFTGLMTASYLGLEAVVRLMLDEGAETESRDKHFGRTPLCWAAERGNEAVSRLLLDKGAKMEMDAFGQTPLFLAAERGHAAVLRLLLDKGANIESRDTTRGRTPLSWAAENGHEAAVRLLLDEGADIESRDYEYGQTPLSWASRDGRLAVMRLLLNRGADIESRDTSGWTPLSWASERGHEAAVLLLLDKGAEIEARDTFSGRTPLSWAAESGREVVVRLLLDRGAEIESRDTKEYGLAPLSWAAWRGRETVVRLLLDRGAEIESKDTVCGRTPLSWASESGHEVVVRLLLDKGAEIETRDTKHGRTPLFLAAWRGHEAVVRLLLAKDAEIESRDTEFGWTPLSFAAGNGYEGIVSLLLDKGAGIESRDTEYGLTPLSLAAGKGHEAVARLLLDKGAEIESRDTKYGLTPLSWAAGNGHEAIVGLLLDKGAEIEPTDIEYGLTPLSLAAEKGYEAVVRLLLDKGAKKSPM